MYCWLWACLRSEVPMLSENEKDWLERRKNICLRCIGGPSEKHPKGLCWRGRYSGWDKLECDMFHAPRTGLTMPDLKEAVHFEEDCAKRALHGVFRDWHVRWGFEQMPCELCRDVGLDKPAPDDELKCLRCGPECKQMWCRILTEMEWEI